MKAKVGKLSAGEKLSALSAVLLFALLMFFDWFGLELSGLPQSASGSFPNGLGDKSAWDALETIPYLLILAIAAAIGVAVVRLTDAKVEMPVSLNAIVAALGALAALLILYRILEPGPDGQGLGFGITASVTLKPTIFFAFSAAAGIFVGGYSAMREEKADADDQSLSKSQSPNENPGRAASA
jgi:hypothetical protein